jgi:flagellar biosynthesis protein FliQ
VNEVPSALMREGFTLLAMTAGPFIAALLVVGLIMGILQATTQINDPAVGFLPRFAVALLGAWGLGHWVLERYAHYFADAMMRMSPSG